MCALFGDAKAVQLRNELEPMTPPERESTIVNGLAMALKGYGHRFVLPFCFKNKYGTRTTHHLILVTKHFKGYEVMKDIMARSSSSHEQGVPSFTYSPAVGTGQQLLFELNRPLDDLKKMLLKDYAGETLTTRALYERHSVDRPFLLKNYKDVLSAMEKERSIQTIGRKSTRRFADHIQISFPPQT
jgi:hypothetical protein